MKDRNGIPIISEVAEAKAYEKWLRQVSNFPNWDKMNSDTYDFEENEREKRGNEKAIYQSKQTRKRELHATA